MAGLERRLARLEEQEIAAAVEQARRHCESHGLPFDAEARAGVEAFERYRRSWPTGLDLEEQIQRAAAWSAARLGVSPEELIAEAERLAGECAEACPDE